MPTLPTTPSPSRVARGRGLALVALVALALPAPSGALEPAPAASDPDARAAAAVRVGEADAALEVIRGLPPRADRRVSRAVLAARAHLLRGDRVAAREAIAVAESVEDAALRPAVALWRLRVAAAGWQRQSEKAAPDAEALRAIVAAADRALSVPDLPIEIALEARRWRALALAANLDDPAAQAEGLAALRALTALTGVAERATSEGLRAAAWRGLAEYAPGKGEREAAARRLLLDHGADPEGQWASAHFGDRLLSDADRLARARALYTDRAYELAEPLWAALTTDRTHSAAVRQEAALVRGIIRLRLFERYDEATKLLRQAARGPVPSMSAEAVFRGALVRARRGRYREASAEMVRYLRIAPRGPLADEARFERGRLLAQGGDYRSALPHLKRAARGGKHAIRNLWFVGWAHYRAGDCRRARHVFDELAARTNLLEGPKALYWTARCALDQDRPKEARAALDALAERAAESYYGVLGAHLAHERFGASWPPPRRIARGGPLDADLRPFLDALAAHPEAERLAAIDRLVAAGHPELARRRAIGLQVGALPLPPEGRQALTDALDATLERWGARWKRERAGSLAWHDGLHAQPGARQRAAYPPAWNALATAAGKRFGVPPWWIAAHLLQESRFRVIAQSRARALGPMQLLGRTGVRIATALDFPIPEFRATDLFDPGVALRHGAWYLSALREDFGGSLLLAAAAYNGGPRRIADLLSRGEALPFDVWVEEIGAHESRNYLRKIGDHLARYADLYADEQERAAIYDALRPPKRLPRWRGEVTF